MRASWCVQPLAPTVTSKLYGGQFSLILGEEQTEWASLTFSSFVEEDLLGGNE